MLKNMGRCYEHLIEVGKLKSNLRKRDGMKGGILVIWGEKVESGVFPLRKWENYKSRM